MKKINLVIGLLLISIGAQAQAQPELPAELDIVFLVDTSETMDEVINQMQLSISAFVNQVQQDSPGARFGLATFTDVVASDYVLHQNLTANAAVFINAFMLLTTSGGDDCQDDSLHALDATASGMLWGPLEGRRAEAVDFCLGVVPDVLYAY